MASSFHFELKSMGPCLSRFTALLRTMKPAWDKLMSAYDEPSVVVAEVDCAGAGKSKCDDLGVKGFPTVKQPD